MPVAIQPKTEVARIILGRINEMATNVRAVANRINVNYETLRQVVKGDRPPPRRLLRDLTRELSLDFDDIWEKVTVDRLRVETPGLLFRLAGITDPEVLSLARSWSILSREQKEHIRWLVDSFVAKNSQGSGNQILRSAKVDKRAH